MALTTDVAASVGGPVFHVGRAHAHAASLAGIHKIRHVVVVMQENRSFDSYFGTYPGADGPNAPSHMRASLMSPEVLVPLQEGKLALGRYQGIFFCEFDGPRERKVYVTALR